MPDEPDTIRVSREELARLALVTERLVAEARRSAELMREVVDRLTGAQCVECGRLWIDQAERWRSLLDDDDTTRLFCPGCAEREGSDS